MPYFGIFAQTVDMKFFLLVLFGFGVIGITNAQVPDLVVRLSSKGPYVEHKVTAKENYYSIGRDFNVHPRHLATYNGLNMTKGLSVGQTVNIPLTDTNYTHKSPSGVPVYYVTSNGETVYNVSTNNGVLMEQLRKWNQLPADRVPAGSKLIVGYLVTAPGQPIPSNNPAQVTVTPKKDSVKTDVAKGDKTPAKNIVPDDAVKKTPLKKDQKVETHLLDSTGSRSAQLPATPKKDSVKTADPKHQKTMPPSTENSGSSVPQVGQEGYFRQFFEQQVMQQPLSKAATLSSGIFKSSSGWSDGKYYLLMSGAEPGTIVKITNPANNKVIFAKLLGEMTNVPQNQGLNLRISNAAASALEIASTDQFVVRINY
jgi:LysM repeat protein